MASGPTDGRGLMETTWEAMEGHLASHLRGSFLCVQAVLPGMFEGGWQRFARDAKILGLKAVFRT